MQTIAVLQNTAFEHLGLIEDHLEGRNIRFRYIRPTYDKDWRQTINQPKDGLIVLGAAPYGTVGTPVLDQLEDKIEAVRTCLKEKIPVLAISTGTQILSLASGNPVLPKQLTLEIKTAHQARSDSLNGYMPEKFPVATYMRDLPAIPEKAEILATFQDGSPAVFQMFETCLGFIGHPGMKSAMIEDSFVQIPEEAIDASDALGQLRVRQRELEDALVSMMTGIIQITGWMN